MMARHCAVVFIALAVCCSGLAYSDNTHPNNVLPLGPSSCAVPARPFRRRSEMVGGIPEAAFGRAAEL